MLLAWFPAESLICFWLVDVDFWRYYIEPLHHPPPPTLKLTAFASPRFPFPSGEYSVINALFKMYMLCAHFVHWTSVPDPDQDGSRFFRRSGSGTGL